MERVYGNESEKALFAWNVYGEITPAKQTE